MTLTFIVTLIGVIALNFWHYKRGWRDGQKNMIATMAENPDVMLETFRQVKELEIAESATEVEAEEHNNMIYIYNKETKLFLGQGIDLDDAMRSVCERFPDQAFWCNDEPAT